jgi:hypothetical protein
LARFSKRSKWIVYGTMGLAIPNFAAFIVGSVYFGGDALNGYVHAKHYFLCAHGSCTEVSQSIWKYSYWHAICALANILLVFIEWAVFANTGDIVS